MSNKIEIIKTVNGKEEKQIFYVSDEKFEQIKKFFENNQKRKEEFKQYIKQLKQS